MFGMGLITIFIGGVVDGVGPAVIADVGEFTACHYYWAVFSFDQAANLTDAGSITSFEFQGVFTSFVLFVVVSQDWDMLDRGIGSGITGYGEKENDGELKNN